MRRVRDYRDDPSLLEEFYRLTRTVFGGFSLKEWRESGYWDQSYVPRSYLDSSGRMVANASTTLLPLVVAGTEMTGFQVGTVATLPEYRHRGLSRALMESIVDEVGERPLFLFANPTVLDFYPKFGLRPGPAQSYPISDVRAAGPIEWVPARLEDPQVHSLVCSPRVLSVVFDIVSPSLNLFHLLCDHRENLYLSKDRRVALVAELRESQLEVYGLFASQAPPVDWLLGQLSWPGAHTIRYHFEPDGFGLPHRRVPAPDPHFFVNQAFPALPSPWLFPALAVT